MFGVGLGPRLLMELLGSSLKARPLQVGSLFSHTPQLYQKSADRGLPCILSCEAVSSQVSGL